jgi:DNA-binding NarL/FixJ family response regulator
MERWLVSDIEWLAQLTRVVVLTASERLEDGLASLRLGARAVVHKRLPVEALTQAIHAVVAGFVWMPPALQAELIPESQSQAKVRLTGRECDVVRQVALGLRNAGIAKRLSIGEGTVKSHVTSALKKLGLHGRVELTRYAYRAGLVDLRD